MSAPLRTQVRTWRTTTTRRPIRRPSRSRVTALPSSPRYYRTVFRTTPGWVGGYKLKRAGKPTASSLDLVAALFLWSVASRRARSRHQSSARTATPVTKSAAAIPPRMRQLKRFLSRPLRSGCRGESSGVTEALNILCCRAPRALPSSVQRTAASSRKS